MTMTKTFVVMGVHDNYERRGEETMYPPSRPEAPLVVDVEDLDPRIVVRRWTIWQLIDLFDWV